MRQSVRPGKKSATADGCTDWPGIEHDTLCELPRYDTLEHDATVAPVLADPPPVGAVGVAASPPHAPSKAADRTATQALAKALCVIGSPLSTHRIHQACDAACGRGQVCPVSTHRSRRGESAYATGRPCVDLLPARARRRAPTALPRAEARCGSSVPTAAASFVREATAREPRDRLASTGDARCSAPLAKLFPSDVRISGESRRAGALERATTAAAAPRLAACPSSM
jgi:hypothetical protein